MLLLLAATALAVPKAFSDDVVVLAVSAEGTDVLVGTAHSFVDDPDHLRVRSVATPLRPVEGEAELLACVRAGWCPEGGPWYGERTTWLFEPSLLIASYYQWSADGWTPACDGRLPCTMARDGKTLDIAASGGDLVFTETAGNQQRVARLRTARLRRLGVDPGTACVHWGTERVLVAARPTVERTGTAEELLFAWVLPGR